MALNPSNNNLNPSQVDLATQYNYIGNTQFNFTTEVLPNLDDKEYERYGNQNLTGFLQENGFTKPMDSDLLIWGETNRRHVKYVNLTTTDAAGSKTATFTVGDPNVPAGSIAFRQNQNVLIMANTGGGSLYNKGIISSVNVASNQFTVKYYETAGQSFANTVTCSAFIFGSEFAKGSNGMQGSVKPTFTTFNNKPVIMKDRYQVNGSDTAQIAWLEPELADGTLGPRYWYLKGLSYTHQTFLDLRDTKLIEDIPAQTGSDALAYLRVATDTTNTGGAGSEGLFYGITQGGNTWGNGYPTSLGDFDSLIQRLDNQAGIIENLMYTNRAMSNGISDFLGSVGNSTIGNLSYGLFQNKQDNMLKFDFTGLKRSGYEFYYTTWKYLIRPETYGQSTISSNAGGIRNGVMIPMSKQTVYDTNGQSKESMNNIVMRYRTELGGTRSRLLKTWVIGSVDAQTSDSDTMDVHYLSEMCLQLIGRNNFFIFNQF